jgi:hypothetical protein
MSLAAAILAKIPPKRKINFMTLPKLTNWIGGLRSKQMRSLYRYLIPADEFEAIWSCSAVLTHVTRA